MQLSLPVPIVPADPLVPGLPTMPGVPTRADTEGTGEFSFEALLNPPASETPAKTPGQTTVDPELAALLAQPAVLLPTAVPVPSPADFSASLADEGPTAAPQDDGPETRPETPPWTALTTRALATATTPSPFSVGSSVRTYAPERVVGEKKKSTPTASRADEILPESAAVPAVMPLVETLTPARAQQTLAMEPDAANVLPSVATNIDFVSPEDSAVGPPADRPPFPRPKSGYFDLPGIPVALPLKQSMTVVAEDLSSAPAIAEPGADWPESSVEKETAIARTNLPDGTLRADFQPRVVGMRANPALRTEMNTASPSLEAGLSEPTTPPISVVRAAAVPGEHVAAESTLAVEMPRTEKIAVVERVAPVKPVGRENKFQKQFLSTKDQQDANALLSVGTDVADKTITMATLATPRTSTTHTAAVGTMGASQPWAAAPESGGLATAPEKTVPMAAVRETMTAVLNAVEALASRADKAQASVHMDFQVGAEKLGLHLALREGTVYTIFRTDSAELRTALGQEWQAVVPGMTTRDSSIAAPVFASAAATSSTGADSASTSLGQGHPQQRGGQPAPETHFFSPGRPVPASGAVATTTAAPAAAPVASTSLLHAFA